eukprot:g4297.t1
MSAKARERARKAREARAKTRMEKAAAVSLQRLWRGFRCRSRISVQLQARVFKNFIAQICSIFQLSPVLAQKAAQGNSHFAFPENVLQPFVVKTLLIERKGFFGAERQLFADTVLQKLVPLLLASTRAGHLKIAVAGFLDFIIVEAAKAATDNLREGVLAMAVNLINASVDDRYVVSCGREVMVSFGSLVETTVSLKANVVTALWTIALRIAAEKPESATLLFGRHFAIRKAFRPCFRALFDLMKEKQGLAWADSICGEESVLLSSLVMMRGLEPAVAPAGTAYDSEDDVDPAESSIIRANVRENCKTFAILTALVTYTANKSETTSVQRLSKALAKRALFYERSEPTSANRDYDMSLRVLRTGIAVSGDKGLWSNLGEILLQRARFAVACGLIDDEHRLLIEVLKIGSSKLGFLRWKDAKKRLNDLQLRRKNLDIHMKKFTRKFQRHKKMEAAEAASRAAEEARYATESLSPEEQAAAEAERKKRRDKRLRMKTKNKEEAERLAQDRKEATFKRREESRRRRAAAAILNASSKARTTPLEQPSAEDKIKVAEIEAAAARALQEQTAKILALREAMKAGEQQREQNRKRERRRREREAQKDLAEAKRKEEEAWMKKRREIEKKKREGVKRAEEAAKLSAEKERDAEEARELARKEAEALAKFLEENPICIYCGWPKESDGDLCPRCFKDETVGADSRHAQHSNNSSFGGMASAVGQADVGLKEEEEVSILSDSSSDDLDDELYCPLTLARYAEPVIAADGFTYEKRAILEWLKKGHKRSPMTNLELSNFELKKDHDVIRRIRDLQEFRLADEEFCEIETSSETAEDEYADEGAVSRRSPVSTMIRMKDGVQLTLWRAIAGTVDELVALQRSNFRWIVLMVSAGRFAGACFERGILSKSKTVQRYVTRRGQGGSQSAKDSTGKIAQSAGSSLRRQQEINFRKDVAEILLSWKDQIAAADVVWVAASKKNRNILFSRAPGMPAKPQLEKTDPRIHFTPFQSARPTLEEAKRVCRCAATCLLSEPDADSEEVKPKIRRRIPPQYLFPGQTIERRDAVSAVVHEGLGEVLLWELSGVEDLASIFVDGTGVMGMFF